MDLTKKLVIVGFSGFGKEVYWLASRLGVTVSGFLDDSDSVACHAFDSVRVLGKVDSWVDFVDCQFVIAVGNPRVRKKIYEKMTALGTPTFATLVDPSAIFHMSHVNIGAGSIICAGTVSTVDISIGSHVIVNLNCTIGHDAVLEDFVTIAPMVAISGNVHIHDRVEVGTGSCIRQGLIMETGSMLGMGSVLTKNVKRNVVFFGNPAKAFKVLPEDEGF